MNQHSVMRGKQNPTSNGKAWPYDLVFLAGKSGKNKRVGHKALESVFGPTGWAPVLTTLDWGKQLAGRKYNEQTVFQNMALVKGIYQFTGQRKPK